MKLGFIVFIFSISLGSFSEERKALGLFNKKMSKEIKQIIEHNPQLYETRPIIRKPASVNEMIPGTMERLDEIEEQAGTHRRW